jgi:uncharacterized protein YegP (UPF0339 family)
MMIKAKNRVLFCFLIFLMLSSCREFIEPSLDDQEIKLLAPSNNAASNSYQQTFWWETHQDALQYRLQIVKPTFTNIEKLVLDTIVRGDKFSYTLDPGNYQWRVRAENGSSVTKYAAQSFTIYPASLADQIVQVTAPGSLLYTANNTIQYEWLKLFGATQYRLQVDKNNFSDENNLVLNQITDKLFFNQTLLSEGNYQFRVRAENATEISKWSLSRTISDADKYELFVFRADSITLFSTAYPQTLASTAYTFNGANPNETLVWRVRAVDKTGNKGLLSDFFSFTSQN